MVAVGGDSGGCGGDVGGDDGNGGGDDDDDGGGVEDAEHVEEQVEGGGWPHPHGDGRDLGQSRAPHRHRSHEAPHRSPRPRRSGQPKPPSSALLPLGGATGVPAQPWPRPLWHDENLPATTPKYITTA